MIASIGKPVDRVDGRLKVTGGAHFAAEHNPPQVAYAALVTSTIAAGSISSIDTAAARSAPGVFSVFSHLNAPAMQSPGPGSSAAEYLHMPFSDAEVHYVGQAVAVVVADTLEHATHGAELVKVSYVQTPAKISLDAFRSEAKDRAQPGRPSVFNKGDAEGAFGSAAVKVDEVYVTPHEHHNPMEPHAVVAVWDGDHLTLQDASQNVFGTQKTLAKVFGIPKENVRVISKFVGGAFGCKGSSWPHVFIGVMAARLTKRPVKLVLTRKQMFSSNGHRPETEQRVALGASTDGKLVSMIHEGICSGNSVCDFIEGFTAPSRSMYQVPNVRAGHKVVELNQPSATYMRAPGENPGMYALESAMDELAAALKMDPIQLRLLNHADVDPVGDKAWTSKSLKECYTQGAERFGWSRRSAEPRSMKEGRLLIGWGMASSTYPAHRMPATARAEMKSDGSVLVTSGSQEMGMGTATVMSQLAAETLGVPVTSVRFELGDTDLPEAPVSGGSMTTASVGSAVFGAADGLKKKIIDAAFSDNSSPLHGATYDEIDVSDGRVFLKASPSKGESYTSILGRGYLTSVDNEFKATPAQGDSHSARAFGAHFVEVTVDQDLAIVRVRRVVSALAAGRILNAKTAHSQYLGGIVQGIGMALLEETHLDERMGAYTSVNLADYLVPVNADIPLIDVVMVPEEDSLVNPIGVKGIGEVGIVGVAAAVANAVYHATGKRVRDLPITLDKLL